MAEPSYLKLIRIHDRIWESDHPQDERELSCQMMANTFGRWREIEWTEPNVIDVLHDTPSDLFRTLDDLIQLEALTNDVLERVKDWYLDDEIRKRALHPEAPAFNNAEIDLWNAAAFLSARESALTLTARCVPYKSEGHCTRCRGIKPRVFFIQRCPLPSFSVEPIDLTSGPTYEASCKECLTDAEIAKMLAPIAAFVIEAMLHNGDSAKVLAPAVAYLKFRLGPGTQRRAREKALEALV